MFRTISDPVTGKSLTPHLDAVKDHRRTDPALTPRPAKVGDCTGVRGRRG